MIINLQNIVFKLKYFTALATAMLLSLTLSAQQQFASLSLSDGGGTRGTSPATTATHAPNKRTEREQLLKLLKGLSVPDIKYNAPEAGQWSQMATLFTRLRLYPLAMKCYLKTISADSLVSGDIPVTDGDQQTIKSQFQQLVNPLPMPKSPIVKVNRILETFQDGKPAMAYAMILHVKQAVRGTRKVIHKITYSGHTFITLIKFNTDSSYTQMSFGFGAHKDNLLAATPLMPSSTSKFTDDGAHDWDEVVGKFISKRRFEKILQLTKQYDGLAYNLSTNNCTDFGLKAARLAGLEVWDTKGSWPLGGGNCPGTAGESILQGKFTNADTGNLDGLFIDTALTAPVVHKAN